MTEECKILRNDERGIIQIDDIGDCLGNNVEGSVNGGIVLEIDNPWAGSSETGFGQSCRISLTPETAKALGEWLLYAAEK